MRLIISFLMIILALAGYAASEPTSNERMGRLKTDTHMQINMQAHIKDNMGKTLILLATPPAQDVYYTAVEDDIFKFHIAYAKAILEHDDVIILASPHHYTEYAAALGENHVAQLEMQDIWMRDFSPLNAVNPVMTRYSSAGQGGGRKGQSESDFVQEALYKVIQSAFLRFTESNLINDGGNFVDDYAGNVVLSRKFLRDNKLSERAGRAAVKKLTGARNVAFIDADEQGGLEHADGVVAFISENVLVINAYPEDPQYSQALKADLIRALPKVTLHEIITPYEGGDIYDKRFGSACGLYTNMLVTPERIYFPQFGIPEDGQALSDMRRWSDKQIIPVSSQTVCKMGGGVRCMSWQVHGADALRLAQYLRDR